MILEVDMGNTRIKWRWLAGGQVVASGAQSHRDTDIAACWTALAQHVPARVRVACVGATALRDSLSVFCLTRWGVRPGFAVSTVQAGGVINAYSEPSRLGVDRWLALLATHQRFPGQHCLVVDCGSAATVDLLAADGRHLGGYIVPGIQLMQRALLVDTAAVRVGQLVPQRECPPGLDTASCVSNGLPLMLAGLCREAQQRMASALQVDSAAVAVIATGGDAESITALLPGAVYIAGLVLDGLAFCELQ
jgi:type III pantothenate kinase